MEANTLTGAIIVPFPWYKQVFHPINLTWSRVYASIPILVMFSIGYWLTGLGILIAAEATDYFDGYLARRWGWVSPHGAFLDTLADKLLHLPLFCYFLLSPKPELPHFFLIHDLVHRIGYSELLLVIVGIETVLIATRSSVKMQKLINWLIRSARMKPYVDLQVVQKKDAKIFGKIKTWIQAFSIGFYTLSAGLVARGLASLCHDLIATFVTAAQVLVVIAVGFGLLSLQSRFTLKFSMR